MFPRFFGFAVALALVGCATQIGADGDRATRLSSAEFEQSTDDNPASTYPSFSVAQALEELAATSANASIGDLNGDGNLDILLVKGRHWPLEDRVLFGDGAGDFSNGLKLSEISDRSYSGSLTDLDLDGDLDIVVSNDRPDASLIYLNNGNGLFVVNSTFGKAEWPTRNASVADMNADGLVDVIVANRFGGNAGGNFICLNEGSGNFAEDCVRFSTESSTTITPADLDGDGLVDLVVPHRDGGQSFVYLQEADSPMVFRRVPFGPSDAVIRATKVADFNGDGYPDIVAINAGMSEGDDGQAVNRQQLPSVSMFFGQSGESFSNATTIGNSTSVPYSLIVGDLNSDGAIDVVVGYVEAPSAVYFNNKARPGFTAVQFGDGKGTVYGFDIGDLNDDGHLDIVAARSGAVNVVYFGGLSRP